MNPFDLPGPEFLAFYIVFGSAVIAGLYIARGISESGTVPKMDYSNPYLLAYLRGGERETIHVAAMSLIDRGLLRADGEQLSASSKNAEQIVHRPVEKALLGRSRVVREIARTSESGTLKAACKEYKDKLEDLGLLPNEKIANARVYRLVVALILLFGVAFIKVIFATLQGRQNIVFLLILAGIFGYIAIKTYNPFRTALGNVMLADLKTLFSSLKTRAATIVPGGSTGEAALLMAVFGATALPSSRFPIIDRFEEYRRGSSTACGGSGCGGGSSSSCCSGGSGCGGCGGGS